MSCSQPTDKGSQATIQNGWKLVDHSEYSIQHPENWDFDNSGQMGTSFFVFSKQNSPQDQFKENVNLLIQDLTGNTITMDQYVAISEEQVKTMITNGNLLESKRVRSGSSEFHKMVYTGDQGIFKLKFEQYYWIRNSKAYVLTLTCEMAQFDNYKETGEKILNSFVLK
jgi:hypothetical protein